MNEEAYEAMVRRTIADLETIQDLQEKLAKAEANMTALLRHVGQRVACKGCGKPMVFVRHADSQSTTPYDLDGTIHFATCPEAEQYRRKKKEANG